MLDSRTIQSGTVIQEPLIEEDLHFWAVFYSGAPPSALSPRDQLHRQGHQGPPGLWLRLWEGGPPQVCGHQDSAVGKCFSGDGERLNVLPHPESVFLRSHPGGAAHHRPA